MTTFLAVFIGKQETMAKWNQLSEEEKAEREKKGMEAWGKWVTDRSKSIIVMGSPLGKTTRINKDGISDFKNELCAYTVVQAENHDQAARMFLNHPHFSILPGDSIELIECLAIPGSSK